MARGPSFRLVVRVYEVPFLPEFNFGKRKRGQVYGPSRNDDPHFHLSTCHGP